MPPFFSSEPAGYDVVHDVTPATDVRALMKTLNNKEMIRFGPGQYNAGDWGYLYAQDIHLYTAPANYGAVHINFPIRTDGIGCCRFTGLDFHSSSDSNCIWSLGGNTFITDCQWHHTPGTDPWDGAALSSFGASFDVSCILRHSNINFATDTLNGTPILMKDAGYLRMTGSANGWLPHVYFAKGIGIQVAGCGAYLHNVAIHGPGKNSDTIGLEVARGGGDAYMLKSLTSSVLIENCGTALQATSMGDLGIRSVGQAYILKNCKRGIMTLEGGYAHLTAAKHISFQNVDIRYLPDADEFIIQ